MVQEQKIAKLQLETLVDTDITLILIDQSQCKQVLLRLMAFPTH
jgi:hypothetical protein